MSKRFDIKPPMWPREYSFREFAELNPHIINENQLINLYNQYLNKYLTDLGEKKIHFKQSKINHLLTELKTFQQQQSITIAPGGGQLPTPYSLTFTGNTAATGTSDYVSTTFDPIDYELYNGFTLSYWVRPDEIPVASHLFVLGRKYNNNQRFTFGLQNASKAYIGVGNSKKITTAHEMSVGTWYNWIITFAGGSGGALKVYRNNTEILDSTTTWDSSTNKKSMYFGARNAQGVGYDNGWACGLDEVAIYDKAQDRNWIKSVYGGGKKYNHQLNSNLVGYWRFNEGSGTKVTDHSPNGNHGTLTAGTGALPTWSTDVPE